METFSALLAICAGNSPVPGEFPAQRPVTRSFDVFFDLRLKKRLSKQSRGWRFETLPRALWRHSNANLSPSKTCDQSGVQSVQVAGRQLKTILSVLRWSSLHSLGLAQKIRQAGHKSHVSVIFRRVWIAGSHVSADQTPIFPNDDGER